MSYIGRRTAGLLLASGLMARAPLTAGDSDCPSRIFQSFDSRLDVRVVGRVPAGTETPRGFEVVRGTAIVAFERRILFARGPDVREIAVADPIRGIAVDRDGRLLIRTSRGPIALEKTGLVPALTLTNLRGTLIGSGGDVFLEATIERGVSAFVARRSDRAGLPLFRLDGIATAVDWNSVGLAAIVRDDLVAWTPRARDVSLLAHDEGLRSSRDLCLVAPDKAVVELSHATVVLSQRSQIVLVGAPMRPRWNGETLYCLDERTGFVWALDGIDKLGDPRADLRHARSLVERMTPNESETSDRFLEAARIVGCRQARHWRASTKAPKP